MKLNQAMNSAQRFLILLRITVKNPLFPSNGVPGEPVLLGKAESANYL